VVVALLVTGCFGGGTGKNKPYAASGVVRDAYGNGVPDVSISWVYVKIPDMMIR
jgi:hypothetical protein